MSIKSFLDVILTVVLIVAGALTIYHQWPRETASITPPPSTTGSIKKPPRAKPPEPKLLLDDLTEWWNRPRTPPAGRR